MMTADHSNRVYRLLAIDVANEIITSLRNGLRVIRNALDEPSVTHTSRAPHPRSMVECQSTGPTLTQER